MPSAAMLRIPRPSSVCYSPTPGIPSLNYADSITAKPASYPTTSWQYLRATSGEPYNQPTAPARCKLRVAIIGAGIGGLSAAIALAKDGHQVEVYENAPALAEIGAGIQIPPNSSRILHSWGLENALQMKAVRPKTLRWKRWQDGTVIGLTRYEPDFQDWFSAPYYVAHRAELHEVLHDRVKELGVSVYLGKQVTQYDMTAPRFSVEGVGDVETDLVVAADGQCQYLSSR